MAEVGLPEQAVLLVVSRHTRVVVVTEGEPLFGERFDHIHIIGTPDREWLGLEVACRLVPGGTWMGPR